MQLKLSLHTITQRLGSATARFPLVFVACIGLAVAASLAYWNGAASYFNWSEVTSHYLTLLVLLLALSIPLFSAAQLYREAHGLNQAWYGVICLVILLAIVSYGWLLSPVTDWLAQEVIQYLGFSMLAWGLLFCAPLTRSTLDQLWKYGVVLLVIMLIAMVCAGIVWGGVSLGWAAIISLFDLPDRYYDWVMQFWIIGATLLAPAIVLSTLPRWQSIWWQERLAHPVVYPAVLNGFIDYILLPLAGLLTVIVYVYLLTILVHWEWPKEGVTTWIMVASVWILGVWLLSYPRLAEQRYRRLWLIGFSAFLPLAIVQVCAIGIRIAAYGFTPARYAVLAYGVWLAITVIYQLMRRQRGLLFLLASWLMVVVLGTWSPVNAYTVSRISQVARLEELLAEKAACADVNSIVKYLLENYRDEALHIRKIDKNQPQVKITMARTALEQLLETKCDEPKIDIKLYGFRSESSTQITGQFSQMIQWDGQEQTYTIDGEQWTIDKPNTTMLTLHRLTEPSQRVNISLTSTIEALITIKPAIVRDTISSERMVIPITSEFFQGQLWIQQLTVQQEEGRSDVDQIKAILLIQ